MKNQKLLSTVYLTVFLSMSFLLKSQIDVIHIKKSNCMTINGKAWVFGPDSSMVVDNKLLLGMTKTGIVSTLGPSTSTTSTYRNGESKEVWLYITNMCENGEDLYRPVEIEFRSGKVYKTRILK
jgi:hypothetical protein